ncbi:armadillo-type protein [Fimicolochytrium jonesii]|uniref:armadillo-type protein n=1 Tax=Fimicolochytrium jonesii TaxID=1396493 RepID=UPI0022FF02E7|nr:armadillo-type protein [Fimicolochytrium jonesii]KAI8817535.1 armadillo-type protein [Fimicolochytrium jonesii]
MTISSPFVGQNTMSSNVSLEEVLRVLQVLFDPSGSGDSKTEANKWLESFQKLPSAWAISDQLLQSQTLPPEVRLFAAQTLRQKIEFDFTQLEQPIQESLRDSLLHTLHRNRLGSKPLVTQLCLSLADVAMQMFSWEDPVKQMIQTFGKDVEMVGPLLEFLASLAEEFTYNNRIQMDNDEIHGRADKILRGNAREVLNLLLFFHANAGGNTALRRHILDCLLRWLRSGDIEVAFLTSTPLIGVAFDAVNDEDLFETATDLICEICRRTRPSKKDRPYEVINEIYPMLLPLRTKLEEEKDNPDVVRDLCRVFTNAAEAWPDLIVANYEKFVDVIEGLLECATSEDLDIVKITFRFWESLKLEVLLEVNAASLPKFHQVYQRLIDIIIQHLHYPEDLQGWSAEERDEFRDFRHEMGDVLKDCVQVLGAEDALARPYAMLCALLDARNNGEFDPSVQWQRIEAPLFAFRAMCREVRTEVSVLPKLMEMIPHLPDQPKIRYATILVIGRYADWTSKHPEFISYQLNFVFKGFADPECTAAASQTLKFLGEACAPHLVNHLEQLHQFYSGAIQTMNPHDAQDVTEAMAYILAAVPLSNLGVALQTFIHPMAQQLHAIAAKGKPASEAEEDAAVAESAAVLHHLGTMLRYSCPDYSEWPATQAHPAIPVIQEIWPVLDNTITLLGHVPAVSENFCRCCAYLMMSYKFHLFPVLSPMMAKIVEMFNKTGFPSYLWASWRCAREYGSDDTEEGKVVFEIVETLTNSVFVILQSKANELESIPGVIEDYFKLVRELLDQCPLLFFQSPLLPSLFNCAGACLSIEQQDALHAVISFTRELIRSASPTSRALPTPVVDPIVQLLKANSQVLVGKLFHGLIYTFPKERELYLDIAVMLRFLAEAVPDESARSAEVVVRQFPDAQLSAKDKEEFLGKYVSAINDHRDERRLATVLRDFSAGFRRRNLINDRPKA